MASCLQVHLFSTSHWLLMEMSAKREHTYIHTYIHTHTSVSAVWTLSDLERNTFSCASNLSPLSLSPSCPSFREIVGKKVVRALRRKDDGISHACVDFLCALMQPMHDNYDLRQEQMNKSSLLSSKPFLEMVLEPLKTHVVSNHYSLHSSRNDDSPILKAHLLCCVLHRKNLSLKLQN